MKKVIPNTDNAYYATSDGRILKYEKEISLSLDRANNGYLQCTIKMNDEYKKYKVHRLVALAFMGDGTKKVVNHINGCKTDNRPENLEYITHRENMQHAMTLDSYEVGREKWKRSIMKLNDEQVKSLVVDAGTMTLNQMARKYSIGQSTVSDYLRRLGVVRKNKKVNQYG